MFFFLFSRARNRCICECWAKKAVEVITNDHARPQMVKLWLLANNVRYSWCSLMLGLRISDRNWLCKLSCKICISKGTQSSFLMFDCFSNHSTFMKLLVQKSNMEISCREYFITNAAGFQQHPLFHSTVFRMLIKINLPRAMNASPITAWEFHYLVAAITRM